MRNLVLTCCSLILFLLRIILLPFKILVCLVYSDLRPTTVGYAWYKKEDYQRVVDSSRDNLEELVPTYDLWKTKADKYVEHYQKKGWLVVKVNIQLKELEMWLSANGLPNTGENRQKYVSHRMKNFFDNGII